MHEKIPESELRISSKAGRMSNLENTAEFNEHLVEFLKHI